MLVVAAAVVTDTPEFRRWFGRSQVVDANGRPVVVYHGTHYKFDKFDPDQEFHFFTEDKHYAQFRGGNVLACYLSLQNPAVIEIDSGWSVPLIERDLARQAKRAGHDGLILVNAETEDGEPDGDRFYVAFSPAQIKSVDNVGSFDPANPNIYK